jgi:serine/threonine protein kinase
MLNVIQGIRHLIEQGIIHLDLKPINVLVCKQLITKIIDYGDAYHPDVCPQSNLPPMKTMPLALPFPMLLQKSSRIF